MGRWDPRPVSERCSLRSPAPGGRTSAHQELEVSGEGGWRGPGEGWQGSRVQSIPLPLAERYLSLTLSRLSPLQHYDEPSPGHLFSRSIHHVCLFGHFITCEKKNSQTHVVWPTPFLGVLPAHRSVEMHTERQKDQLLQSLLSYFERDRVFQESPNY